MKRLNDVASVVQLDADSKRLFDQRVKAA